MRGISIYEFDKLVPDDAGVEGAAGVHEVPAAVFAWLESQLLHTVATTAPQQQAWLRLARWHNRRAVQVTSFVGVIRAANGFQIEVLPKIGKAMAGTVEETRQLLLKMLRSLPGFRHIQTDSAHLLATHMPLLEVFIAEFLRVVETIVKRGLRSDYLARQDNLLALRGKLQLAGHLRQNLCRRDRFFVQFDEFSTDRPENRLIHAALRRVVSLSRVQTNLQRAREWCFVFADIAPSAPPWTDFQRVRLDRGMQHYNDAIAWARLILSGLSPLSGAGAQVAPSLLFPMQAVFEAFVSQQLQQQVLPRFSLHSQTRRFSLVRHCGQEWFRLQPDLLLREKMAIRLVLDVKWKLIQAAKANGKDKYGLAQSDFYQMHAYAQTCLQDGGDVILIYPLTDEFDEPLKVFEFSANSQQRLWVLPFCLEQDRLRLPSAGELDHLLSH